MLSAFSASLHFALRFAQGQAQDKLCGAKLVAFGDSVTEGVGHSGVTEETSYPEVLRRRWTAELGEEVQVINAGVGGDVNYPRLMKIASIFG